MMSILSCMITLTYASSAMGFFTPQLESEKIEHSISLLNPNPDVINVGNVYAASVRLDGYEIFKVTATDGVKTESSENVLSPPKFARLRAQLVENELKGIVSNHLYGGIFNQGFQKETLTVTVAKRNGITVVIAYDDDKLRERQIVTVTEEDAEFYGYSVPQWAQKLAEIIKNALIRAQQERNVNYIIHQLLWSLIIIAVAIVFSWVILGLQRKLGKQRHLLMVQEPINELVLSPSDLSTIKEELSLAAQQSKFLKVREKQQEYRRKLDWIRLKRRLLQSGQAIIWILASLGILELFPWTRWIFGEFLEKPLIVVILFLGISVTIRLSSICIDRYIQILIEEASICPKIFNGIGVSQRRASRLSTVAEISKDLVFWIFIALGILLALDILEFPIKALLTGAGVLGIAISFVAQSLIKDLINGMQILRQDRYVIGDFIQVQETWGLVEGFSLTVTKIRGPQGRLTTVPNGDIRVVHNLTKEWARIDLYIKISHDADVDLAMKVMQQVAQQMQEDPQWRDCILEPTVLMGVNNLDHTGVEIQYWMKTKATQQWAVGREYRRRLKLAFDEKGIHLGMPQESRLMQNPSGMLKIRDNDIN
ncbi:mechanosensitive ion channel family protein [Gloeothece verrucosa]|nr:mechanosensitive ion channel family protein [Gloeothece verrucosa]